MVADGSRYRPLGGAIILDLQPDTQTIILQY